MRPTPLALCAVLLLGGCGSLTRLSEVGRPPEMSPISDPTRDPAWRPLSMPSPAPQPTVPLANTLWRPGARAFFRDQRASQPGDILTVVVNIGDNADFTDTTKANRNGTDNAGVTNLFGLEGKALPRAFPGANPASLVNTSSSGAQTGIGETKRAETVALRLAAVVTQVLPNGNLVVAAHQEVRVNNELRQLLVSGLVRPEDIGSDNTVQHDRMAEARIAYGGRGQLSDVQAPRYGQQILDAVLPF